jgi:membrane dipeptidase
MSEFACISFLEEARELHKTLPVCDGHNDLPWATRCMEPAGPCGLNDLPLDVNNKDLKFSTNHGVLHTDIPRLKQGGIGWQFWSVYVPATVQGGDAVQQTLEQIDYVHRLCEKYPETFEFAYNADDVQRIYDSGKIASMCGMEGGHQIGNSLASLRMMHRLGCRYMTLTHNGGPLWADSAVSTDGVFLKDAPNNGLSTYGQEVVKEMNRIGMLVDLSHVHHVTMKAAIECSKVPVIFSHSSSRALCAHPRDVPDNVVSMLPANGGVIMVTFVASFIAGQFWVKDGKVGATVIEVADHIDHLKSICGVDHIGIGGDYDGCTDLARGLEDVSCYPLLTAELLSRGYSHDDLKKILGKNLIRVLKVAEDYANECKKYNRTTMKPSEMLYDDEKELEEKIMKQKEKEKEEKEEKEKESKA